MRKTNTFLSLAALALAGVLTTGCSLIEDNTGDITTQPATVTSVTLTTTVSLSANASTRAHGATASTRALDAMGHKTFAKGDQIAIVYQNKFLQTVKAVSVELESGDIQGDGTTASFTVTLTNPKAGGTLRYIYPAAMAKATIDRGTTIDPDGTVDFTNLASQDGTLATLGSCYDLAVYDGALTDKAELPASVTLTNPLCIGEFTIKNADGSLNITPTIGCLTVTDGTNTYAVKPAAPATSFGDGPIYVAMKPVTADKTLTFTINTNAKPKVVTDKALDAGNMYPVGLKFGSSVDLSSVATTDGNGQLYYAVQSGDILSGGFGGYVTVTDGATVTLSDAHIQAPFYCDYAAFHCLGDANIFLAGSENELRNGFNSSYPAAFVPQGKTLTISGTAELYACADGGYGAGIGGGFILSGYGKPIHCGTIVIEGGVISAYGGTDAAGIGSGGHSSCDGIRITGGIITESYGGADAAGIGSGYVGTCGNIDITGGQIGGSYDKWSFYGAIGGDHAAGLGCGAEGTCGDITIGAGISCVIVKKGITALYHIGLSYGGTCGNVTVADCLLDSGEHDLFFRTIFP